MKEESATSCMNWISIRTIKRLLKVPHGIRYVYVVWLLSMTHEVMMKVYKRFVKDSGLQIVLLLLL